MAMKMGGATAGYVLSVYHRAPRITVVIESEAARVAGAIEGALVLDAITEGLALWTSKEVLDFIRTSWFQLTDSSVPGWN